MLPVFRIRIGVNADPDPAIYLSTDLDLGFTIRTVSKNVRLFSEFLSY